MKLLRSRLFWAVFLVALIVSYVRLRLAAMPLERDEGEYAYMGWRLLLGVPPYKEAANMKWPGTYGAYALIMAVFGSSDFGVRVGLWLVNGATGFFLFRLAKRWFDGATAAWATIFFLIWSLSPDVLGLMGHATHFVTLFVVLGFWVLGAAWDKPNRTDKPNPTRRGIMVLAGGVCLGLAILMKQHGALFLLPAVAWTIAQSKAEKSAWRNTLLLGLGTALPIALTFLVLWRAGVWGTFWFWTVDYARQYVASVPPWFALHNLESNTLGFARDAALWGGALLGFYLLWRRRHPARVWLSLGTATALLTTVPGFFFRPHYFLTTLPFLALLAAHFIATTGALLEEGGAARPKLISGAVGTVIVLTSLYFHRAIWFTLSPDRASRAVYPGEMFVETKAIGLEIGKEAAPKDSLAILGSEPQIAFYAHRPLASQFLYTYNLVEPQPFAAQMQRQMAAQVEKSAPKWLVDVQSERSWVIWPGSDPFIFRWLANYKRSFGRKQRWTLLDPASKKTNVVEVWQRF